ncbi:MAG: MarR family transcriptional regulator [Alphaproteobacteria bacterium]|nr:MarR family transcriptional regulator [Alphaproteobacteria bacterium]MBO6863729.1 MarR family transcriptional regulator [Alphaproteobacteria bacterium]
MIQTDATEQSLSGLSRIAAFLRQQDWQDGERLGLTPTQMAILYLIRRRGPLRIAALAAQVGATQATVSDAVTALVAKGAVARVKDPADGRAVLATLTQAGERTVDELADRPNALDDILASLEPRDRGDLNRVLVKLVRGLQGAGAIAPQRLCVTCRFFRPHHHDDAAKPHHCDFVNAAFGEPQLRLDCGDHEAADPDQARRTARRFDTGTPA